MPQIWNDNPQHLFCAVQRGIREVAAYPVCEDKRTDFNIKFPNGSEIIFMGLDEETKLLSLTNVSTIFIEEVYEVPKSIIE